MQLPGPVYERASFDCTNMVRTSFAVLAYLVGWYLLNSTSLYRVLPSKNVKCLSSNQPPNAMRESKQFWTQKCVLKMSCVCQSFVFVVLTETSRASWLRAGGTSGFHVKLKVEPRGGCGGGFREPYRCPDVWFGTIQYTKDQSMIIWNETLGRKKWFGVFIPADNTGHT